MTRSQLIDRLSRESGLSETLAGHVVRIFFQSMIDALCEGRRIEIRGLGTFKVKSYRARLARDPRTGQAVDVPPTVRPAFRMGKEIRERLNAKEPT